MAAAHDIAKAATVAFGLRLYPQAKRQSAQKIRIATAMIPVYFVPMAMPQKIPNSA